MRIAIILHSSECVRVPINQNYFLASSVYTAIAARPEYARFLHDYGYEHEPSGKRFKLFVFSPLLCKKRSTAGDNLHLGPGTIKWVISSPMTDFLTALAEGLLSQGEIEIRGVRLPIGTIEAEPDPDLTSEMSFICLSPIVVSRPGEEGEYAHFCTHEDDDFSDRVRFNLIRKHELAYGHRPKDDRFEIAFDPDYIARRNGRVTKLINIRGTYIRGVFAPFTVHGSPELIQIGYECGFGERGSMGFGCVEINRQ